MKSSRREFLKASMLAVVLSIPFTSYGDAIINPDKFNIRETKVGENSIYYHLDYGHPLINKPEYQKGGLFDYFSRSHQEKCEWRHRYLKHNIGYATKCADNKKPPLIEYIDNILGDDKNLLAIHYFRQVKNLNENADLSNDDGEAVLIFRNEFLYDLNFHKEMLDKLRQNHH